MSDQPQPRESVLLSLGINIAIPAIILMKLSGENALGPVWGLVVALMPASWLNSSNGVPSSSNLATRS